MMQRFVDMTSRRCLLIACMIAILAGGMLAGSASSSDWPGFLNLGTSASDEQNLPESWSADSNVLWKVPLGGRANSSPVVVGNRVYVTDCVLEERGRSYRIASWLMMGLATAVVLFSTLGGRNEPAQAAEVASNSNPSRLSAFRFRFALVAAFLVGGYGALLACEDARMNYPRAWSILGRPWRSFDAAGELRVMPTVPRLWKTIAPEASEKDASAGDTSLASDYYRIPTDCFVAGLAAAILSLIVAGVLGHKRSVDSRSSSRRVAAWIGNAILLTLLGTLFASVFSSLVASLPYRGARTWFRCADIAAVGMIAAVALIPRRSRWRIVGALLVLAALGFLYLKAPHDVIDRMAAAKKGGFITYGLAAAVACAWLLFEHFRSRALPARPAKLQFVGSAATAFTTAAYFGTCIYLLPQQGLSLKVLAVDVQTGNVAWSTTCGTGSAALPLHPTNTLASATPAVDDGHVFVRFGGGGVFCLDTDGRIVWHYDDPEVPAHWGPGSSPAICDDLLILCYDVDERAFTVALDKRNGDVVWTADRTSEVVPAVKEYDSYSTPVIWTQQGGKQIIIYSSGYLCAYDPKDGKELWHVQTTGKQIVPTPIIAGDRLIVGGGDQGMYLGAVSVSRDADQNWVPKVEWVVKQLQPDLPSPVVYDGRLYTVNRKGIAMCIDMAKGKLLWKERLTGEYHASLVAGDGKIYFCNVDGTTTVLAAGSERRVLATNELNTSVQATFAISGGRLFIRSKDNLYCIEEKASR